MSLLEQLAAKAQVTGEVGEKLDKDLEATQAQAYRLQGGSLYVKEAAAGVRKLADNIRDDFEAGKFEGLDAKVVHDLLLDWNRKATECLLNYSEQKKAEALGIEGKVLGLKAALTLVSNHHVSATRQAESVTAALNAPPPTPGDERGPRPSGQHPGSSPLSVRRLEAMREQLHALPEVQEDTVSEDPPAEIKTKRRGRKKAAG